MPIGPRFFTREGFVNLGKGCEMWSGFHLSVKPTNGWKLTLNVDVAATAFVSPLPVIEFLREITGYDCKRTNAPLKDYERKTFSKAIKGKHF